MKMVKQAIKKASSYLELLAFAVYSRSLIAHFVANYIAD